MPDKMLNEIVKGIMDTELKKRIRELLDEQVIHNDYERGVVINYLKEWETEVEPKTKVKPK